MVLYGPYFYRGISKFIVLTSTYLQDKVNMDKILSRKCAECDESGHSSLDCPRLDTAKATTVNNKTDLKLRISTNSFNDRISREPRKPIKLDDPKSDRSDRSESFLRGLGKFDNESSSRRDKRACDTSRLGGSGGSRVGGGFDMSRINTYPRMEIKAKRTRYTESASESENEVEEPLMIQVDYSKPRKTKHSLGAKSAKSSDVRFQVTANPGDLRYQMKSRPLDPHLIPKYKTDEDLRFSIKRPTTESKRKKLRPPQYVSEEESEEEMKPPSPDYEPDEMEDEEALLKEVSGIKRTTAGSLIKFDSSGEDEYDDVKEEVEEDVEEESPEQEEEEVSGDEEEEVALEEVEVKSEPQSGEDNQEEGQEESSSSDDEESSSNSESSSEEGEVEESQENAKKPFIDIREKYESQPTSSNPLSARLKPEVKREAPSSDDGSAEPEVKKPAQKKPRTSPQKQAREKDVSGKSGSSQPKTRDVQQKPKKSKEQIPSKGKPQKSSEAPKEQAQKSRNDPKDEDRKSSQKPRDSSNLSKEDLLKPVIQEEEDDSFSDGGEDDRAHSGALATVEDTKSRKVSPEPAPKPEKIVPIFPFKTKCKPKQFPESTVPFIDSHCHIDYLFVREQNYGTFASYIESKDFPKNFSGCVANFCDPPAWGQYQMYEEILEEDGVWGAFGLHPHNARHWSKEIEKDLIRACSHPKCVAWGEMGLDYGKGYHEASPDLIELQKDAFLAQIKHALKLKKPFVIHARGAELDAFEMMKVG